MASESFSAYLSNGWNDHATDAAAVAATFSTGVELAKTEGELAQFAGLVTHVMGEHLARWEDGRTLLESFKTHPTFVAGSDLDAAINRSVAVMTVGAGGSIPSALSKSDRIRIAATAASALNGTDTVRAVELFRMALSLADDGLTKEDPANRALAITGNNLACTLEEKPERTTGDVELMILAAQTGRKFWELAGTWDEVSSAEYRLANTYLKARRHSEALTHAKLCYEIRVANKAGALDMFFAYEVLALAHQAMNDRDSMQSDIVETQKYFDLLSEDDKVWCKPSLEQFKDSLRR